MEQQAIKEFIEDDGTLINSKMPPNINRMATSKQTTDQHVASSRQGMVWMNYRRFYGEAGETLPFAKEADQWKNSPEKFFNFLKSKGKQDEFGKYFVKKDDKVEKTNVTKVLKEAGKEKMQKLIEDLVAKKRDTELVKKTAEDKPSYTQLKERETLILNKLEKIIEDIQSIFTSDEQDVILDYITQMMNA